jgi:integrase/recombinase XerD
MANLHVTIVVRTTSPEGKRGWVKANGKTDPPGPLYLRHCQGRKPRYEKAGAIFDEAEASKFRLERKLKAESQGFLVPEETVDPKKSHRIPEVITAYLADLRLNRRPEKSIKSKKFELEQFARFCGKTYVEEIRRADLIAYRNHLLDAGKAPVTAINKLMSITTWLKKNTVVSITGLLKAEDWPKKPDTEPRPYSDGDLRAMMDATASHEERLLLRFFLGTGMREQEVAHAELSDIKDSYIQVQAKPQWGWSPKTDAGTRKIPLGDRLLADLKDHCPTGLLFPNTHTLWPQGHYLRIIQKIAERARVVGAGCHRFRDTFATEQVRARVLDLRDIAKIMGHEDLSMMKLYAAFVDLESEQARKAANVSDRFGGKPGPQLVKAG